MGIVHAVAFHVVKNSYSVLLFFLLDVVEGLTHVGVLELEDGGVVGIGHVFLRHQHVVAQGSILLRIGPWRASSAVIKAFALTIIKDTVKKFLKYPPNLR